MWICCRTDAPGCNAALRCTNERPEASGSDETPGEMSEANGTWGCHRDVTMTSERSFVETTKALSESLLCEYLLPQVPLTDVRCTWGFVATPWPPATL